MSKTGLFLTALLLGILLGYTWRMVQVDPVMHARIELIRDDQREISHLMSNMDGRLMAIEAMFPKPKAKKGGRH